VSCPERSGNRRGHVPLCSQTRDTAAASPAQVPARRLRPMLRRRSPWLPRQPSWPLCSSSFCSGSQWTPARLLCCGHLRVPLGCSSI
jgi:hypothetical protein